MNREQSGDTGAAVQSPRITIRKMTGADVSSYCTLFKDVFSDYPWNEKWTVGKIEADIKKLMRKKGFLGMTADAGPGRVGYLTGFRPVIFPSVFYLEQLFVDKDHQGKKIGNRLLAETTRRLKSLGVSRMVLLTKTGTPAEAFYAAGGYEKYLPAVRIKGKTIFQKSI